jgi:CubicO group peptidase (beta-lactamase class C family)
MSRTLMSIVLCAILSLWLLPSVNAQSTSANTSINQPQGVTDKKELEVFLDKLFAEEMSKFQVSGAIFVLVKDGEIFFAKGYGYADAENKKPVDSDKTLFRAYSVSKSFTATAVMQLVERGQLELDEDVNKYLKRFKVKDKFTEPVTLAHLLTHRAGFTDTDVETQRAQGRYRVLDLGEYLAQNMPPRSRPPGKGEYSNFGVSLAGYIVEEVSGEPFAKYIENHIFKPLGMRHSSFLLPAQLPPQIAANVAVDYFFENGTKRRAKPDEGDFSVAPAGNLLTTGKDIARFMIAHLQNGRYKDSRILSEASSKRMHEPWLYTDSPKDFGYGFQWRTVKGQRVMFHAGATKFGSISLMQLFPEHNMGVFFSYTSGNDPKREMRAEIASQFKAHYFTAK